MVKNTRIRVLDAHTAQQIAAGEVVDSPSSILRELLDNSIDAHSTSIEVVIKKGGIELLHVSDNGEGMSKDDLALCCKTHATSKISSVSDLQHITSMGFRGEALASISSVSRTTITSHDADTEAAHYIIIEDGKISPVKLGSRNKGTSVTIEKLFYTVPARKRFLAPPSTEKKRIQTLLAIKAATFPHIAFTLKEDSKTLLSFPVEDQLNRAVRITHTKNIRDFVWQDTIRDSFSNITISCAAGTPNVVMRNRKHIHIFINKRNIKEYKILQAIEYAYRNVIHTSLFPQVVLFLNIPPEDVDVNIHPAKQEVRIKDITKVRSFVISTIESLIASFAKKNPTLTIPTSSLLLEKKTHEDSIHSETHNSFTTNSTIPQKHKISLSHKEYSYPTHTPSKSSAHSLESHYDNKVTPSSFFKHIKDNKAPIDFHLKNKPSFYQKRSKEFAFLGCLFGTYAMFEKGMTLFLLDFHATHEKKIFDTLKTTHSPQTLLIPIPLTLSYSETDMNLLVKSYEKMGIIIKKTTKTDYTLFAVPDSLSINADTIAKIIEDESNPFGISITAFASKACKMAIKAGDHIDNNDAFMLLEYALDLNTPRCPHGRPLWVEINKDMIDEKIGRK